LILINGKVITVDAHDSVAEAVAIQGGKIVAVGTNEEIRKLASKNARIVDLHGRTATPGLIDTHCHFDATDDLYAINLSKVTSVAEAVELVRKKVVSGKPGAWIQGAGWDEGKLSDRRYITAADLDRVSPNNPVWLTHTTGHYGVANSAALRLAKISRDSKDPDAGTIDRSPDGTPTGVLKETAMQPVRKLIPEYTRWQQRSGLLKMMADFNAEGMTAAKDPGTEGIRWDLYRELLDENKSTVRIFALLYGGRDMDSARKTLARLQSQPKPPESQGDGMLLSGGVKLFMDGSGGGRTAWVYDPWLRNGQPDTTRAGEPNTGYPNIDPPTYREMVKLFHEAGRSAPLASSASCPIKPTHKKESSGRAVPTTSSHPSLRVTACGHQLRDKRPAAHNRSAPQNLWTSTPRSSPIPSGPRTSFFSKTVSVPSSLAKMPTSPSGIATPTPSPPTPSKICAASSRCSAAKSSTTPLEPNPSNFHSEEDIAGNKYFIATPT